MKPSSSLWPLTEFAGMSMDIVIAYSGMSKPEWGEETVVMVEDFVEEKDGRKMVPGYVHGHIKIKKRRGRNKKGTLIPSPGNAQFYTLLEYENGMFALVPTKRISPW